MDTSTQEFERLLALARHNDAEAMATLCQQYESKLRIVARVLLGPSLRPHLDSVDLVQSVHRTLLLGMRDEKYDVSTPEKLLALALTIVRRKVARHWRNARRQQRLSRGATRIEVLPALLNNLRSADPDPAAEAQQREQVQNLFRALNATERRILQQRADGHTTAEIAEALGISHIALRVRITRLRERLRSKKIASDWV